MGAALLLIVIQMVLCSAEDEAIAFRNAEAVLAQQGPVQGAQAYATFVKRFPRSYRGLLRHGDALSMANQHRDALPLYTRALALCRETSGPQEDMHMLRGRLCLATVHARDPACLSACVEAGAAMATNLVVCRAAQGKLQSAVESLCGGGAAAAAYSPSHAAYEVLLQMLHGAGLSELALEFVRKCDSTCNDKAPPGYDAWRRFTLGGGEAEPAMQQRVKAMHASMQPMAPLLRDLCGPLLRLQFARIEWQRALDVATGARCAPDEVDRVALETEARQWHAWLQAGDARLAQAVVDPLVCLKLPHLTAQDCLLAGKVYAQARRSRLAVPVLPPVERDAAHAELVVGLLTADVRMHAMLSLVRGFMHYGPFRRILFHTASEDVVLEAVCGGAQFECVNVGPMDDAQAAAAIRQRNVTVLVDAAWETAYGRPQISLARPAPVQVLWAGYPASSGSRDAFDYILTDTHTVPEAERQRVATEVPLYVPTWLVSDIAPQLSSWLAPYRTPAARASTRATSFNASASDVVLMTLVHPERITLDVFDAWQRVAQQVPALVVVLRAAGGCEARLRAHWKLAPDRLRFVPHTLAPQHLTLLAAADLSADTPLYNGGITTLEALFAGLPVVHLPGSGGRPTERMAGSMLRSAGLERLLASSLTEYEGLLLRLASDARFLRQCRATLADAVALRGGATLFDVRWNMARVGRALEAAFGRWRDALAPAVIHADQPKEDSDEL